MNQQLMIVSRLVLIWHQMAIERFWILYCLTEHQLMNNSLWQAL
jgi:hypothetical protein